MRRSNEARYANSVRVVTENGTTTIEVDGKPFPYHVPISHPITAQAAAGDFVVINIPACARHVEFIDRDAE